MTSSIGDFSVQTRSRDKSRSVVFEDHDSDNEEGKSSMSRTSDFAEDYDKVGSLRSQADGDNLPIRRNSVASLTRRRQTMSSISSSNTAASVDSSHSKTMQRRSTKLTDNQKKLLKLFR